MPILGIFLFLVVIAVFLGAVGLCLTLTVIGFAKNKWWLKLLGGVPLFFLTTGAAVVLYFGLQEYGSSGKPEVVFRNTFGFEVPADVEVYGGSYFASGQADVVFRAPPDVLHQIVTNGFEKIERADSDSSIVFELADLAVASNSLPAELLYYRKSPFQNFSSDEAYLVVNTNTGLVFFKWLGVD